MYFLLGTTEEEEAVYIGQAARRKNEKGVLHRILGPHRNINYRTESIIITNANNSFGATELNYLEHHLHEIALEADRFKVTDVGAPHKGSVTE